MQTHSCVQSPALRPRTLTQPLQPTYRSLRAAGNAKQLRPRCCRGAAGAVALRMTRGCYDGITRPAAAGDDQAVT